MTSPTARDHWQHALDRRDASWWIDWLCRKGVFVGGMSAILFLVAIFLFIVVYCANIFAPEATLMMNATGVKVDGMVTDGFFGFNLADIIISLLHRMFG